MSYPRIHGRTDELADAAAAEFARTIIAEHDPEEQVFEIRASPLFDVDAVSAALTQMGFGVKLEMRPRRLIVTRRL